MGNMLSMDGDHPDVVLVPPLFERDHKGRSRMAKSSYDFQFAKPQLKWLFRDYNRSDARSLLHFSPPEDPRVSITARVGASLEQPGKDSQGSVALRFQPEANENLTFFDLKAAAQAGRAQLRACYFDHSTNLGAFAALPLTENAHGPLATAGLRFSSPELSAGFITQPFQGQLTHVWLVAQQGAFTYGWQCRPHLDLHDLASHRKQGEQLHLDTQRLGQGAQSLHSLSSYSVAYSPARPSSGGGRFTAAVEVREQRHLVVSFLHHLALQRQCRNYFEDAHVVGITNYLDLGMQVVTPLASSQKPGGEEQSPHLIFGAAWQANKNLLVKARAGTADVSLAAAFKAWWQPSLSIAASLAYDFAAQKPRLGINVNVENYGNIRYERSQETQRMGKALVQRHVAQQHDLVNKSGEGLLVRQKDLNDPHILGQERPDSDRYL